MNTKLNRNILIGVVGVVSLLATQVATAEGCLKGAAVGGVAGHVAGHHGVIGAGAGCLIGRHRAKKEKEARLKSEKTQAVPASSPTRVPSQ